MGQLASAVQARSAPFVGFCGGAQILSLLEARAARDGSSADDIGTIDRVLQRLTGEPIRGFAVARPSKRPREEMSAWHPKVPC